MNHSMINLTEQFECPKILHNRVTHHHNQSEDISQTQKVKLTESVAKTELCISDKSTNAQLARITKIYILTYSRKKLIGTGNVLYFRQRTPPLSVISIGTYVNPLW